MLKTCLLLIYLRVFMFTFFQQCYLWRGRTQTRERKAIKKSKQVHYGLSHSLHIQQQEHRRRGRHLVCHQGRYQGHPTKFVVKAARQVRCQGYTTKFVVTLIWTIWPLGRNEQKCFHFHFTLCLVNIKWWRASAAPRVYAPLSHLASLIRTPWIKWRKKRVRPDSFRSLTTSTESNYRLAISGRHWLSTTSTKAAEIWGS